MKKLRIFLPLVLVVALVAPVFADTAPYKFIVTGDSRGDDGGINGPIVAEMVPAIIAEAPDLVVVSGDLVDNGILGELPVWVDAFMKPLQDAGIAVLACRGNHDGPVAGWNAAFTGPYAFPGNGPMGEENLTYSFVHKTSKFISLDQYVSYERVNQAWLDGELSGMDLPPHVFVFGHMPAFKVDHDSCLAAYPVERDTFWNSLGAAGCVAYFCGHDHFYNHSRVMDAGGRWVHQYVVGTAGAPLYNWSPPYADPRVEGVSHYKNYGYLVVDINGLDATLTFKERTAPGVFTATTDTFTYTAPARGEAVPAVTKWGLALLVTLLLLVMLGAFFRLGLAENEG